mgnify:CR=1 FL=1
MRRQPNALFHYGAVPVVTQDPPCYLPHACVGWQQVLTIDFASIHIIITPANLQTCKLAAYVHQSNSFIVNQQINQTIHRFAFIRAL